MTVYQIVEVEHCYMDNDGVNIKSATVINTRDQRAEKHYTMYFEMGRVNVMRLIMFGLCV